MANVRCKDCGLLNFADAGECKRCRKPLDAGGEGEGDGWWRAEAGAVDGGAPRCGFCGYETATQYCPRCKARITQPEAAGQRGSSRVAAGSGGRALRALVVLALVGAASAAGYFYRHRLLYGPHADLAVAIRDSEEFSSPLTVKARRRVTALSAPGVPVLKGPGPHADAVYVLAARGLVKFGAVETEERVVGTVTSLAPLTGVGGEAEPPQEHEVTNSYDSASVSLTESGWKAAEGWDESDDGGWLVPIGARQLHRIEEVGEVEASGAGVETCEVKFSWRWVPEGVGESFDTDGKPYLSLPETARRAAEALDWGSAKAYRAVATLERAAGGEWRVKEIRKGDAGPTLAPAAF